MGHINITGYRWCRYVFQTDTKYTLCMSGTGHAGMEATIANLVEPGETVVVGNKGSTQQLPVL
jgi:aspartate aminotransferase-like enzyme